MQDLNLLPTVSVVIPCYNHGQFIEGAIESVTKASSSLVEIIIINDGSTDAFTINKLAELRQNGYNILEQENLGLGAARNNGIKLSKGEYILLLDSDNLIESNFIEKAINILHNNPDVGVVYGDIEVFGNINEQKKVPEFDYLLLLSGNFIDACTIVRKKIFEEVGYFDINRVVMAYSDWELWIRIGKTKWKFYHLNEITFYYRVVSNSMIEEYRNNNEKHLEAFNYIINKHFDSYSYLFHEFGKIRAKLKVLESENLKFKEILKNPLKYFRLLILSKLSSLFQ